MIYSNTNRYDVRVTQLIYSYSMNEATWEWSTAITTQGLSRNFDERELEKQNLPIIL